MPASAVSTPLRDKRRANVDDNSEKAQQVKPVPAKNAESGETMVLKKLIAEVMAGILETFR